MKKRKRLLGITVLFFIAVVFASGIGSALGLWLFRPSAPLSNDFAGSISLRLDNLEKSQRDLLYRHAALEQAAKEKQRLQNALEFHQQMMDKNRFQSSSAPVGEASITEQPRLVQPAK
jgi:hypothetical protein